KDDAVGNSPGVRRELAEGIGSLPAWRNGVYRKKTETRWKISGIAKRLVGVGKWELVGRSLGLRRRYWEDRYEHAERSPEDDRETRCRECQRLPDCGSEVVN
ncbi:hypothetical protein BHM03_00058373, partial [Ensete ventricosum]